AGNGRENADGQSIDPQAPRREAQAQQGAGSDQLSAEARRLHARLYDDAEETELGPAQGREGEADQRLRGGELHPGRRPQSAGTFRRADPRRPREGPSGRALPHSSWRARYAGCEGPKATPLGIRSKKAEVIFAKAKVTPAEAEPRAGVQQEREIGTRP